MSRQQLLIKGNIYWSSPKEFYRDSMSLAEGREVLLVMNASTARRLSLNDWAEELSRNAALTWIDQTPSNPDYREVFRNCRLCSGHLFDLVIALGGGSIIDMAKSLVALSYLKNKGNLDYSDVLNSISNKEYLKFPDPIPIYAVPTTAGTGSEATSWATVWDLEGKRKYSIEASWLCPTSTWIIPEFTVTMPKRLTLATGLDALCHAVEAYWAKSSNVMVRELAKTSIRLIVKYLPKVLSDGTNLSYRKKMCLGSLFAGLAFAHTHTTACHSISYRITMCFGIEHGLACALTLAQVMEINRPHIEDKADLMEALGVNSPAELQIWLDQLTAGIVKLRLGEFGIEGKDIPDLVSLSFTQGRMDNNPVDISPDDVYRMLRSLL